MEDNVQTIIMTLVAIIVFFIFPTYVAYEKKDDISYLLALKYTQTFVDSVRSKGYVSKDMYNDYLEELAKTGNTYDVNMEHVRKRAEPVTNYYKTVGGQDKLVDFRNQESRVRTAESGYSIVQNTYRMDEEVISGEQVAAVIGAEDFYQMNVGDEFTVILKNTNTTFATIFYNLVTVSKSDTNTRIYVNYGGSITNETWTEKKIYNEYEEPIISNGNLREILMGTDTVFNNNEYFASPLATYTNNYVIEFKAKPGDTTELPNEGIMAAVPTDRKYNFLISEKLGLGVSVGINGVTVILSSYNYYCSVLSHQMVITKYTNFKIVVRNMVPTLYIDGLKVAEGIAPPNIEGSETPTEVSTLSKVGRTSDPQQCYIGNAMDIRFYDIVAND